MAIIKSDGFSGVTDSVSFNGRTPDHALGGSGSETWYNNASVVGSGTTACRPANNIAYAHLTLTTMTNFEVRLKFNMSANTNFSVYGLRNIDANSGSTDRLQALLVPGSSQIRVRETIAGATNDRNTASVTVSTSTDYYLSLLVAGLTVTARVLASDGTTLVGAAAVWNASSITAAGTKYGFAAESSGNSVVWDDFTVDDGGGGGGGSARRPPVWF